MRRAKWGKLSKEDSRALFGLHTCLLPQREIQIRLRHAQAPESCPVQLEVPRTFYLVLDGEYKQSLACQVLKYIRRTMRAHDGEHAPDHVQAVLQIRLWLGRPKDSACPAKGAATEQQPQKSWVIAFDVQRVVPLVRGLDPSANPDCVVPQQAFLKATNYISGNHCTIKFGFATVSKLLSLMYRAIYATTKVSSLPLHPPDDGQPHIHILAYSYSVECDLDPSLTGLEGSDSAVYAIQVWYLMAFSG
jgi:hypothetical protein